MIETHETIFSTCRRILGSTSWGRVLAAVDKNSPTESFPDTLVSLAACIDLPDYIADLARLEWILHRKKRESGCADAQLTTISVNPTLQMVPVGWKHLTAIIRSKAADTTPIREPAHVMIWRHPKTGQLLYREAGDIDLLALKLIVEQIDPRKAAILGKIPPGDIQAAIDQALAQGFLMSPDSRIQRAQASTGKVDPSLQSFLTADLFTLQWHITQACDLHCKHCYDRSERTPMAVDRAMAILDDLYDFCRRMNVRGQVTFTGGNPLLYPHFDKVYRAASRLGFGIAVLGNPTPMGRIEQLLAIARPLYFQVSLEGLAPHNDYIRGKGHFEETLAFLKGLRELNIFSMVMLTLTRDNLDQVLPLAELLQDRVDFFTFNRLSTVGEGAKLLMPEKKSFEAFLSAYKTAAADNPVMGFKDNLFNLLRRDKDEPPFGGCTGYGCGAAFNFLALLPDGEVHACRKFPSPIGNIGQNSLYEIYHAHQAARYRAGSHACVKCDLNLVCRGCLAITHRL